MIKRFCIPALLVILVAALNNIHKEHEGSPVIESEKVRFVVDTITNTCRP